MAAPKNAPAAHKPAPPAPPVIETGKPMPETAAVDPVLTAGAAQFSAANSRSFAYEIEDDVPLPIKRVGVKGESIYPFDKLAVNQSFFVGATDAIKEPWKTLTSMASRMSREMWPKKFLTARHSKKLPDGTEVEGVRIWRNTDATEPLAPPRKKASKAEPAAEQVQQAAE